MLKTIVQLEQTACKYWPQEILASVARINPIPLLVKTQDNFLSILKCADATPTAWRDVLKVNSTLTTNIFLKHLSVLSDIGGERLQRFARDFALIFSAGYFDFEWNGRTYQYVFSTTTPQVD